MLEKGYKNTSLVYLKILFVHEESFEQEYFIQKIAVLKHRILRASSKREAMNLISSEHNSTFPIDLLLTQYKQSTIDGLELLKEAKQGFPALHTALLLDKKDLNSVNESILSEKLLIDGIILKTEKIDRLFYFISSLLEEKIAST